MKGCPYVTQGEGDSGRKSSMLCVCLNDSISNIEPLMSLQFCRRWERISVELSESLPKEIYPSLYWELWQRQPKVVKCGVYLYASAAHARTHTYVYIYNVYKENKEWPNWKGTLYVILLQQRISDIQYFIKQNAGGFHLRQGYMQSNLMSLNGSHM